MKIGIIYKEEDKIISGTAKKVIADVKALGFRAKEINKRLAPGNLDLIITLGGDGTILRAARIIGKTGTPILPVHLGGLGILTEISLAEIGSALANIKSKNYQTDSRMMLSAEVIRKGEKIKESLALNDIVIAKSSIARTIVLEAFAGRKSIATYVGDGLLASTPTGSTAYNYALNGPILPPQSQSYILSPICAHRGANRSIVLGEPVIIKNKKGEDNLLTIDGQEIFKLKMDDEIRINRSKYKTNFIRLKDYDIWELMRKKLNWG